MSFYEPTPTLLPAEDFDPEKDAEVLRKAMKGFGTDEKAIINVLGRRTNDQRQEIATTFKTCYGKDLLEDLKSETGGKFEDLLVALMTPLPDFFAKEIHDAISGLGTDEDVLIEVMCTMNNDDIRIIKETYQQLYSNTLEDDLISETAGTFKRMLVSLCTAARDESMVTDPEAAAEDARSLLQAGELQMGTDESTFNKILCQRNYAQLALIFDEYENITGHSLEDAVKNEFSGDCEDGFLAIIRSVRDCPKYYAKRLHEAMKGMGTNDKQLIRIIATRCEVDMGDIKNAYEEKYGKPLADAIKDDCSGDYKKCLLALIGDY